MSVSFHAEMARQGHLYKLTEEGMIVGGAILFLQGDALNIGRIFVAPEHFGKGYGSFMMREIESMFPGVKEFTLDTPEWNTRTNSFYTKLGYAEIKRDGGFVYYAKRNLTENMIRWAESKLGSTEYAHILDDDRRINAEKFEEMFYQQKDDEVSGIKTDELLSIMKKLEESPELLGLLKSLIK